MERGKTGVKHHVLTDFHGVPLVAKATYANEDDRKQLVPMGDAVPKVTGQIGAPKQKPRYLLADRGDDSEPHRQQWRRRDIEPVIGKRNTSHGRGLGKFRWPVERTLRWIHPLRRLRARWEKLPSMHDAFLQLSLAFICFRFTCGFAESSWLARESGKIRRSR